jgi:hypothetical protein
MKRRKQKLEEKRGKIKGGKKPDRAGELSWKQ